jgi:hypothetical protein
LLALPRGERHVRKINSLPGNLGEPSGIETQSVSGAPPKPDFEPLEHSVYFGRQRLGRYSRIAERLYAAFDAEDRPLGEFRAIRAAYAAVAGVGDS